MSTPQTPAVAHTPPECEGLDAEAKAHLENLLIRDGWSIQRAKHIARMVNSHAALVAACEAVLSCAGEGSLSLETARKQARAALALAREGNV